MRCDTTTETFEVLCDLTRTPREALIAVQPLVRRKTDANAAFVLSMGARLRQIKKARRFEADQLARWAGEGGYEP